MKEVISQTIFVETAFDQWFTSDIHEEENEEEYDYSHRYD